MKNKLLSILVVLALVMALLMPALSLAEARFPTLRGPVTDDANALSESLVTDIEKFQTLSQAHTGVTPHVAIVHFLDGLDAQTYANDLFVRWNLGENDFLLLGAVGEDSFASVSGKEVQRSFSNQNAKALASSSGFSELFKAQQYDAAFGKYFVAFADMLGKQYGGSLRLGSLFSGYQTGVQASPGPSGTPNEWTSFVSDMWEGFSDRSDSNARNYDAYHEQREKENNGLSPAGWVVLALLVMLIFGQSDPVKKARRNGCAGCGCSPLGWLFSLLGLGALFGRKR